MSPELTKTIAELKASGHKVLKVSIDGVDYIYTNFLRSEWNNLQNSIADAGRSTKITDGIGVKEIGEDVLVTQALLSPTPTEAFLKSLPAGTVTNLSELILKASGFTQETQKPVEL